MTEADAAKKLISDIGKQLNARETCPKKDFIVKLLRQAASAFSALDQAASLKSAIKPLRDSLIKHSLLQHRDKDVRLLVAISCCEVIRVLAPNPDFSDAEFRDIFKLFLSMFEELAETSSAYFSRRAKVLETVAKLKFCVLMLDTGCDDLVLEMFTTFFTVVREHYPQSLITAMVSIMTLILKEKVSQSLLDVILQNILKEGKGTSPASSQLAVSVIQNCTEELEPFVCRLLTSCISDRDATGSKLKEFYHEIIFEIFQCAPQMLLAVIPTLAQELLTDQVDVRIKAVNLIGRLFALPGQHIAQEYRHLFIEFLKRFSDKSAEVRLSALLCAKALYMTNPAGTESLEILTALEGRLLDFDDRVRIQAVSVVCDVARSNLKCVPPELISRAIERLRDKKVSVRKRALQKLLEVYRDYCTNCSRCIMTSVDHFEQIPCRVLMLCYDKDCKDFRPQGMELVIAEDLFPSSLPIEERTRHWVSLFSLFSPPHIKALTTILSQKRRLQTEMQVYLALRKKEEENSSEEVQKRVETSFAKMSASFPDPSKAEECFRKLHLIKDDNILNALSQLLDEVTIESALTTRDGFLKKIGDKHPQYGFLQLLSTKCSYNIFSLDHVCIILDLLSSNGFGNKGLEASSMKLLLAIINVFPSLLRGSEKLFQLLLLKEDIPFNEELIQMIAKYGPQISIKLSDIYPSLERVCLEGTRSLSKLAVSAIAALVGTSEKIVYSELCKTLVDSLYDGMNIPTKLQSLGCLAQHSVSTFEAREEEITLYITEKLFKMERSDDVGSFDETSACSHSCTLKIYGLKALVKSFLPHRGIHVGRQVDKLLDILSKMLQKGDVFGGSISSEADKAHIRLAAAKSVLRLSRRWDLHISTQIFRLTVLTAKDSSSLVRRLFVDKVHKLLKDHIIPSKYACAFAFAATDLTDDSLKYMEEFIREYGREARKCQTSESQGGVLDYPAYMVVYLVHVLAHDVGFPSDNCLDEELYARLCRPLVFTLQALVNASFVDGDVDLVNDAVSNLRSIFHAIKKAEDAVDAHMTTKLHILAGFGISIVNALDQSVMTPSRTQGRILLPSSLYRLSLAEKAEPANLHTKRGFDENIIKRIVQSVESQISRPASNLAKRGRKCREDYSQSDIMKGSTSNLALCRNAELLRNGTREQKSVSPITGKEQLLSSTGKEQLLSSCDSVATKPSSTQKEDLICSTSLEENKMGAGMKSGVLIGQRIKLWSPIDECYYLGTVDGFDSSNNTHKIAYDSGEVEVVSLESENWETISDDSLRDKDSTSLRSQYSDPLEPSSLSSQTELAGAFRYDASDQQENLPKESGSFFGRKIPRAGAVKEKKKHKVSVDTSASEVINVNMDAIARRTRKRKA